MSTQKLMTFIYKTSSLPQDVLLVMPSLTIITKAVGQTGYEVLVISELVHDFFHRARSVGEVLGDAVDEAHVDEHTTKPLRLKLEEHHAHHVLTYLLDCKIGIVQHCLCPHKMGMRTGDQTRKIDCSFLPNHGKMGHSQVCASIRSKTCWQ